MRLYGCPIYRGAESYGELEAAAERAFRSAHDSRVLCRPCFKTRTRSVSLPTTSLRGKEPPAAAGRRENPGKTSVPRAETEEERQNETKRNERTNAPAAGGKDRLERLERRTEGTRTPWLAVQTVNFWLEASGRGPVMTLDVDSVSRDTLPTLVISSLANLTLPRLDYRRFAEYFFFRGMGFRRCFQTDV